MSAKERHFFLSSRGLKGDSRGLKGTQSGHGKKNPTVGAKTLLGEESAERLLFRPYFFISSPLGPLCGPWGRWAKAEFALLLHWGASAA